MERQNIRVDIFLATHVWEPQPTDWWGLSDAVFKSTHVLRMYVSPLYSPLYASLAPPTPLLNLHHCGEKEAYPFFVVFVLPRPPPARFFGAHCFMPHLKVPPLISLK